MFKTEKKGIDFAFHLYVDISWKVQGTQVGKRPLAGHQKTALDFA
jgi:hypothetical protein